jgi:hypothetical protein
MDRFVPRDDGVGAMTAVTHDGVGAMATLSVIASVAWQFMSSSKR